jgi:hypothetical protein
MGKSKFQIRNTNFGIRERKNHGQNYLPAPSSYLASNNFIRGIFEIWKIPQIPREDKTLPWHITFLGSVKFRETTHFPEILMLALKVQ